MIHTGDNPRSAAAAVLAVMVIVATLYGVSVTHHLDRLAEDNHRLLADVESVTNAEAQARQQAATAELVNGLAHQGERERLITELPISEAKADTIRVDASKARLAELDQEIKDSNQRV